LPPKDLPVLPGQPERAKLAYRVPEGSPWSTRHDANSSRCSAARQQRGRSRHGRSRQRGALWGSLTAHRRILARLIPSRWVADSPGIEYRNAIVTSAVLLRPHRDAPSNRITTVESQAIQRTQDVFGRTLTFLGFRAANKPDGTAPEPLRS
jgi:hypothetical protein